MKSGNDYVYIDEYGIKVTFHMTGKVLTSINFNGDDHFNGTYVAPIKTIADVLATVDDFPTKEDTQTSVPEGAWIAPRGNCYKTNDNLWFTSMWGNFNLPLIEGVSEREGGFTCSYGESSFTFKIEQDKLTSITADSLGYYLEGTYAPASN